MPSWNPAFPEVLGLEWLANYDRKRRVSGHAPAGVQRLRSTVAETINSLKMSAAVNPLLKATVPTLVDVIVEGSEFIPLMTTARLAPNADKTNEGWVRSDNDSSVNCFQNLDEATNIWGSASAPAAADWIRAIEPSKAYACSVDAAIFAQPAGAARNGRIGFVGVSAIMGTNAVGVRKMGVAIEIGGMLYPPAGGGVRDVGFYGAMYDFFWGEINPATQRPWTPADIADFGSAGTSRIFVRSQAVANAGLHPRVHALSLNVAYATTENRVAVGVYNRPSDIGTERLVNVETTSLRTMPAGTSGWSKLTDTTYLLTWRQPAAPSEYGPVIADDIRWNGLYQDLGPGGQPSGVVFPLTSSGAQPAPSTALASDYPVFDQFGRPERAFASNSHAAMALAMVRADAAISVDSQPYRLDIADLVSFRSGSGILGQRMTPASSQNYLGVRLPVIPPDAPGAATLTITVHRVSDGVQLGGSFTMSAATMRALPQAPGGWRYVTGFLSSAASLVGATQYEVRLASDGGGVGGDYIVPVLDASLAPTASFGGTTDGAVVAGVHQTSRDLTVNLIRQPDPPTGLTASIVNVPVTTYVSSEVPTVQHVQVTWTAPAVGMGGIFSHYELERQLDSGDWHRVGNINNAAVLTLPDHDREVPRLTGATYRCRAVGTDGRISQWATSNTVTPAHQGHILIFTSNHDPSMEVVYFFDRESTYPLLSNERDETVMIHGSDNQVVFMEVEDRGTAWRTNVVVNQVTLSGKGGQHVFTPLLDLIRSLDVPYVCALDDRGTGLMGHVSVSEGTGRQPQHRYAADVDIFPTHSEPVPVEVS